MDIVLLYVTWPDLERAKAAARTLLGEKLAACANLSPMNSLYRWKGEIEESGEVAMLLKTSAETAERAKARLLALHPYETPCVIGWSVAADLSHSPFLDWIAGESRLD